MREPATSGALPLAPRNPIYRSVRGGAKAGVVRRGSARDFLPNEHVIPLVATNFCCYNILWVGVRSGEEREKRQRTRVALEMAAELEWQKAIVSIDSRFEYGEERLVAIAPMRGRLYVVCYLFRGRVRRIIS